MHSTGGSIETRDAAREGEYAVRLANERAIDHAGDLSLGDADGPVILAGQGAEQPPEAERQGAGDDAERLSACPARFVLLPSPGACAQHPAPERASGEPPAGMAAAHRR